MFVAMTNTATAQLHRKYQPYQDDSIPREAKTGVGRIIRELSIGLPGISGGVSIPIKNKHLLSTTDGAGNLLYSTRRALSLDMLYPALNDASRLLGVYYKERMGVELAVGTYDLYIANDRYCSYLKSTLPGYFAGGQPAESNGYNEVKYFGGPMYGLVYNVPVKKFVLGARLMTGFSRSGNNFTMDYQFKEKGTNYVMQYIVRGETVVTGKPALQAQVNFSKRFCSHIKYVMTEVGIKLAYTNIPYHFKVTTTQQPYDRPATTTKSEWSGSVNIVDVGLYYTAYITKKHKAKSWK